MHLGSEAQVRVAFDLALEVLPGSDIGLRSVKTLLETVRVSPVR